ncbi:hypothetical protein DIPPA_31230 [Diplonema papillatum]|nr:hypothetical protein DIPPA_31230 [Diplonema papillatum]
MEMAADVLSSDPTGTRRKALCLVTDGELQDKDVLSVARKKVSASGAEIFGTAVRRFATKAAVDHEARPRAHVLKPAQPAELRPAELQPVESPTALEEEAAVAPPTPASECLPPVPDEPDTTDWAGNGPRRLISGRARFARYRAGSSVKDLPPMSCAPWTRCTT